jgi:hypothetical protein
MALDDPLNGYRFNKRFLGALREKISRTDEMLFASVGQVGVAKPLPGHEKRVRATNAPTPIRARVAELNPVITPRKADSFGKRYPALSAYLAAIGFVCFSTLVLVGLCFIPPIGPLISSGFGAILSGAGALLGLDATLEALVAGISAFLLVNFGASVSLGAAAGLVGISLLGAANAAWVTVVAAGYEAVRAIKGAPKDTSFGHLLPQREIRVARTRFLCPGLCLSRSLWRSLLRNPTPYTKNVYGLLYFNRRMKHERFRRHHGQLNFGTKQLFTFCL